MKQSIKTNILVVFIGLISVLSFLMLSSQYYFNRELAISSTEKTFEHLASNTSDRLNKVSQKIKDMLNSNVYNHNFKRKIDFNPMNALYHNFTQMMSIEKGIYAMYFATKDGSLYEVVNMQGAENLYALYKATKQTRWTVIIKKHSKVQYSHFDKSGNFLSQYIIDKPYNLQKRLWYKKAMTSDKPITTKPYLFSSLNKIGVTFSTQLNIEGGVFAIDYTMDNLSQILKSQKSTQNLKLFIFNKNGDIFSSSEKHQTKVDTQIMQSFSETNMGKIIKYEKDSQTYFAMYNKLKNEDTYIGISLNINTLLQPHIDNLKYSFSLSLFFLILAIPSIFYLTNIIIKPIKELIHENTKIKNRQFKDVKNIQTNIFEFYELSNSFVLMSKSIYDYQKSQERLLDSIVKLIAEAIDAKSPYTGGHCKRVPVIAQMLLDEATNSKDDAFKEFSMQGEDALREFEIGAWLHDCGKVTTPEYVVDKSTKLETIHNRIHEIRTRFEVLWRDAQISYMQDLLDDHDKTQALDRLDAKQEKLLKDFEFIASANIGGEFMDKNKIKRVKEIALQTWQRNFDDRLGLGEVEKLRYSDRLTFVPTTENLLCDKKHHLIKRENFDFESYKKDGFKEEVPEYLYNYGEVYNLCIQKGTLSTEERYKINEHVIMSIKMLEKIPFPPQMTNIPEYAGTHHETLIGSGYPRKLSADELSIPARVMAIADIFEALTASDRPYKKAKTLSESIKIMEFMVKDKHIDGELFKLFLDKNLHLKYAKEFLKDNQIDIS